MVARDGVWWYVSVQSKWYSSPSELTHITPRQTCNAQSCVGLDTVSHPNLQTSVPRFTNLRVRNVRFKACKISAGSNPFLGMHKEFLPQRMRAKFCDSPTVALTTSRHLCTVLFVASWTQSIGQFCEFYLKIRCPPSWLRLPQNVSHRLHQWVRSYSCMFQL